MMSLALVSGAYAQKGGFYRGHTRVIITPAIGFGYGYGYPYFSYGFGYPFFAYPYGYGLAPNYYRSSRALDGQIAAIRADYSYRIKAARKDKSVSKSERKQNILALKSEREKAIADAELNYRERRMNMNQNRGMNNNQNPGTNNTQPGTNNNQNFQQQDYQGS